ncbi:MAG: fibrobacter succinogenes major paralogous domain-containing protein [Prolixibacteraceae bacterium]
MKKLFLVGFGLVFFINQLVAQVPQCINYQTVVRNSSGHLVKDQSVSLKFSIHMDAVTGQEVYSENHVKTTNQFGIVNLHIGKGTVLSGDFKTINWGAGKMFLKTFLDLNGGDNFTEMGTSEMVSVPYALYAGSVYVNYSNDTLYIGDQAIYLPPGNGGISGNTVTDYDGNVYGTVTIGTQTWLAENLKSTHYADGTDITGVFDYDNNASFSAGYGKLYTWEAAMNGAGTSSASPSGVQGVCPTGFHLPSQNEWNTLLDYVKDHYEVGGALIGQKLKETGTAHWETANGTNETGFKAVGAGEMHIEGSDPAFQRLKERGSLWSATEFENNTDQALIFRLYDSGSALAEPNTVINKSSGLAVRCIKD